MAGGDFTNCLPRPRAPLEGRLKTRLIWHGLGAGFDLGRKHSADFQQADLVTDDIYGFVQQNVLGVFSFLFQRQVIREIAFVTL